MFVQYLCWLKATWWYDDLLSEKQWHTVDILLTVIRQDVNTAYVSLSRLLRRAANSVNWKVVESMAPLLKHRR
jgi:hypothetical protein